MGNIIHPAVTYRALYYLELIAILGKGIQEQQQMIDSLQSKTNKQDSINASLQDQLIKNNSLLQNQLNQLTATVASCCASGATHKTLQNNNGQGETLQVKLVNNNQINTLPESTKSF